MKALRRWSLQINSVISGSPLIGSLKRLWRDTLRRHRAPSALLLPFYYGSDLHHFVALAGQRGSEVWSDLGQGDPELLGRLAALRSRLWWQRGAIIVVRSALIAAAVLFAGALGVSVGAPEAGGIAWVAAAALVALGAGLAFLPRLSYLETARVVDRHVGLKERLATAVELSANGQCGHLAKAQVCQARAIATNLDPSRTLPLRLPRQDLRSLFAASTLVVALMALNARGWTIASLYPAWQETVVAGLAGDLVEQQAKNQQEKPPWEARTQNPGDQSEAGQNASTGELGKSAQRIVRSGALQGELGLDAASDDIAQSLEQNDFGNAAAGLEKLAQMADQMSPEEKQGLAAALRQSAQRLGEQSPNLAQKLSDLADSLGSGDKQSVQRALKDAEQEMARSEQGGQSDPTQTARRQGEPGNSQGTDQSPGQSAEGPDQNRGTGNPGDGQSQNPQGRQPGAGNQAGSESKASLRRLEGEGNKIALQGEKLPGQSDFQRLNRSSNSRAGDTQASQTTGEGGGSSQPLGVAADSNYVPWTLKEVVRGYFSVEEGR